MPQSVLNDKEKSCAKRIMVALDFPNPQAALDLTQHLAGIPCWFKVGMELYYAAGPDIVRQLKASGHQVFLDLKLHDIPNTVQRAAASLTRLGVDMFNVHAAGGKLMMAAAREGAAEAAEQAHVRMPHMIAVTQLTSTSTHMLNTEIGIPGSVASTVEHYASLAKQAGLDGVVSSAQEVRRIKQICGTSFLTVTPGIRPSWSAKGDQVRIMTPADAAAAGADYLVIGRPITAAKSPLKAIQLIIEELMQGERE